MPDRLGETEHHSLRGFMDWSRWVLHVGHQLFDGALAFRPWAIVEIVERVDELRAGIKAFVLGVATSQLGTEIVPGQLHELEPVDGARAGHRPIVLECLTQFRIGEKRHVRLHLEWPGAEQFAHGFRDLVIIVRAPEQGGVHFATVDVNEAIVQRFGIFDLTGNHRPQRCLGHRELRQRFAYRWYLQHAVHLRGLVGDAEYELELFTEAHRRLVISHHMGRRPEVHLPR